MIKQKRISCYIIIFLICFVPRCFFSLKAIPLRTLSDELSTLNGAAIIAGYDWSNVVSHAGYYGFGMTAILGFIFRVFKNPIVIYRVFMVCFAIFQSISGLIAYYILRDIFSEKKDMSLIIIASILSYCVVTRADIAYNEHGLILISWIITFLIYKIFHCINKRMRVVYGILLVITIAFSQMVHARAKIFLIAGLICVFIYIISHIKSPQKLITPMLLAVITIGAALAVDQIVHLYQMKIWNQEGIRNAQVQFGTEEGFDWLRIKAMALIVFGQLNTFALVTAGGIVVSLVCFVHAVVDGIYNKKLDEYLNEGYVYIAIFFFLCFGGTIIAQAVSWSAGVKINIMTNGQEQGMYLKALTFIRYAGPYLGPIMLYLFIYLFKNENKANRIILISIIITFIMQKYWMKYVVPYCTRTADVIEAYICFSGSHLWTHTKWVFNSSTIVLFLVILTMVVLLKTKCYRATVVVMLLFLLYQYCYNALNIDYRLQKEESDDFLDVYEYIIDNNVLENIDAGYLYAIDGSEKTDHQFYYLAQFCFYNYQIKTDISDDLEHNFVIITDSLQSVTQQLDNNKEYYINKIKKYYIISNSQYD